MNRLTQAFERGRAEGRALLIGYLPAGFPDFETSLLAIKTLVESGVDVVEIGLPYSDPLMDGPVIQRAVETSLANGMTTARVLELVASASEFGAPVLVMSYWNPIERYGLIRFATELATAGGVGVITPDLTPEEAAPWVLATDDSRLSRVFLVAPTTATKRAAEIAAVTNGFIYAASLMGVTGVRDQSKNGQGASTSPTDRAFDLVKRVRPVTDQPIAVGIGVSNAEQVRLISGYADGVIVGSLFVKTIADSMAAKPGDSAAMANALSLVVADLAAATKGST
jgi:tryptophan synthase alpha chain